MKTRNILLITAAALILVGVIMCVIAFVSNGYDFRNMNTREMVTKSYDVEEDFTDININVDTANVVFEKSADGKCRVVCREYADQPHEVKVDFDVLNISVKKQKNTFFHVGFDMESPEIKVYLTKDTFDKLNISTDTGDVKIADMDFGITEITSDTGDLHLSNINTADIMMSSDTGYVDLKEVSSAKSQFTTNTGDISLTNMKASDNLNIKTDTGKVSFENVKTEKDLDIKSGTGDVNLNGCDATDIRIKTDTGDVKGSLLSGKEFTTKTDTGDVNVPESSNGGICEITSDTGDINIRIQD